MSTEISRDLTEISLAKTFHWTPEQINKVPYKWLQKFFEINAHEGEVAAHNAAVQKFKSSVSQGSSMSGRTKKYREI